MQVEGQTIGTLFFDVSKQPEVGTDAYDKGADILRTFFLEHLNHFDHNELEPLGRKIIQACIENASVEEYENLIPQV